MSLSTRFINNLRLPMGPRESFNRFLAVSPEMPEHLPQHLRSFLQRYVIRDPDTDAMIAFSQMLESHRVGRWPTPVILDIDVSKKETFKVDNSDVWSYLEKLRQLKNRFFFGALTEAAVELYE